MLPSNVNRPSNVNPVSSGQRARMAEPEAGAPQASATNVRPQASATNVSVGGRIFSKIRNLLPTRDQPGVKPEVKEHIQTMNVALENMRKDLKDALVPKMGEKATIALASYAFGEAFRAVSTDVINRGTRLDQPAIQRRVCVLMQQKMGDAQKKLDAMEGVDMTNNTLYESCSDLEMTVNDFYGSGSELGAEMTVNSGVGMRGNAVRAGAPDQVQNVSESIYTEIDYAQVAEPPKGASGLSKPRTPERNSSGYEQVDLYDRPDTRPRRPEPKSSEYFVLEPEQETYDRPDTRPRRPEPKSSEYFVLEPEQETHDRAGISGRTRVNVEADQGTYIRIGLKNEPGAEEDVYVDGSSLQKDQAQPAKRTPPATPDPRLKPKLSDSSSLAQPAKRTPPAPPVKPAKVAPKPSGEEARVVNKLVINELKDVLGRKPNS